MMWSFLIKFLSSTLFGNLLLLITIIVAFFVGYRQIYLNDVVEIYASADIKEMKFVESNSSSYYPIIKLQNTGTRLVYLDKYIFNGIEYITHGQILPPTLYQSNGIYWVDLPTNGSQRVSLEVYYHDLDNRFWKSSIVAEFINSSWKVSSFPRVEQK